MSLEAKIEALAAAVLENTATLKALSSKTVESAGKSSGESLKKSSAESTKKTDEAPKESKRTPGRPPRVKTFSATEMGEKAREFCESADDDEDEFKSRRSFIAKLAKSFGVSKFSEISGADDQAKALESIQEYLDGDDGVEDGEDGAGY